MLNPKKGVSLITVLMFMLVATIAATATFKWLNSEGDSSAARMREQSAIKAAASGIDNARSWISTHGNEFGAVVKQFKAHKQPVLLNAVISQASGESNFRVWMVGVNDAEPTYKVKLLSEGVSGNYKHRESAILNVSGLYQVSIPQEEPPKAPAPPFDFTYFGGSLKNHGSMQPISMAINGDWEGNPNYVGTNFIVTGKATLSGSGILIGGNACFGGDMNADNGIDAGNMYVHGKTTHFTASDSLKRGVVGDLYIDGPLYQETSRGRPVTVGGNLTVSDTLNTAQHSNNFGFEVGGNLCVEDDGFVDLGGAAKADGKELTFNSAFKVHGNAWATGHHQFYNEAKSGATAGQKDFSDYYTKFVLGTSDTVKLYLSDAYTRDEYLNLQSNKTFSKDNNYVAYANVKEPEDDSEHSGQKHPMFYFYYVDPNPGEVDVDYVNWGGSYQDWGYKVGSKRYLVGVTHNEYHYGTGVAKKRSPYCREYTKDRPQCFASPWFTSKGEVVRSFSKSDKSKKIKCADGVRDYCYSVWDERPKHDGCDNSDFFIPDMIQTAYNEFQPYAQAARDACKDKNLKKWDSNIADNMKYCNSTIPASAKYNGYLVVELEEIADAQKPSSFIDGHYIVIVPNTTKLRNSWSNMFKFVPTANDTSVVFMYLANGVAKDKQMIGEGTGDYNYFIYTLGDIGNKDKHFLMKDGTLKGSLYAVAENCAKIPGLMLNKAEANTYLMNSLQESAVICQVGSGSCGGQQPQSSSGGAESSDSGSDGEDGETDSYHVAIAPQLNVSVESQYEAKEATPSNDEEVAPSYIILPRIAYLPEDPEGTLMDYFSLINLNGGEVQKNASNMSCKNSQGETITSTGEVRLTTGAVLTEGIYTCEFNPHSESYERVKSYIVVEGKRSATPYVRLGETSVELSRGDVAYVKGFVGKSTSGQPCKFSVSVSDMPEGWTLDPVGVVAQIDGAVGGRTYYSAEITPNGNDDTPKDLFKVTTGNNAASGRILFMIDAPFESCIPGDPAVEELKIVGDAKVSRAELSEYCKILENQETCEENGYDEVAKRLGCEDLMQMHGDFPTWIVASGSECREENVNYTWQCKTRGTITLENGNSIPDYCDIFIPAINNTIENPESENSYTLYGSIKRRAFTLIVDIDGNNENNTKVMVKSEIYGSETDIDDVTCYASNAPCEISVLAGTKITVEAVGVGSDEGQFKYWNCSGEDCFDDREHVTTEQWVYPGDAVGALVTGNNTIVANFNKRDEHCFYEDFSGMRAFCSDGETHCVDTCRTSIDKGQVCGAKQSAQPNAEWLMMFNNSKNGGKSAEPSFDENNSAGVSIYTTNLSNPNNQSGSQSVILSTADAGPYGQMTAMMTTTILTKNKLNGGNEGYLNSGLVFRAKMEGSIENSEFLILNVFGVSSSVSSSGTLTARVCKVSRAQGINNPQRGECVYKALGSVTVTSTSMVKISMVIDETDKMVVTGKVGDNVGTTEFDLSPFNTNDAFHKYVGMDLSDAALKLYDIGWQSSSFSEKCWDVPSVICSFRANYLGGRVPQDEDASPWVGVSSWFTENNCVEAYYYNGADNANKFGTDNPGQIGVKLDGSLYKFTESGPHGYADASGALHKDAKIKMSCPGTASSLEMNPFEYSCGAFDVGNIINCKEDVELVTSAYTRWGSSEHTISIASGASGFNLRGTNLLVDMGHLTDNEILTIWLKSGDNGRSLPAYVSDGNAITELNVEVMSNADGFDPQNVTGIIVAATKGGYYTINAISAACPYSVSIHCLDVIASDLDVDHKRWTVKTSIGGNVSAKCSGTAIGHSELSSIENSLCSGTRTWTFSYDESVDLVEQINKNGLEPIKFTFKAVENSGNEDTCSVTTPAIDAMGDPTCEISTTTKVVGAGVPTFTFALTSLHCPSGGCPYTVTFDGQLLANGNATTTNSHSATDKNTPEDPLSIGTHTYKVESYGKICTRDFEVETKKAAPTISSCPLEGGVFTAYITNDDNVSYDYTIGVFDALGNPLAGYPASTGSSKATSLTYSQKPSALGGYIYRVMVTYGEEPALSCEKSFVVNNPSVGCDPVTVNGIQNSLMPVDLTTAGCTGAGVSCTYSVGGKSVSGNVESNGKASFSISESQVGTQTYTVTITRSIEHVSGTETGTCAITAKVSAPAPTASNCAVGETELKSGESTTFSATLANVTSWSLKKDGSQVASGDAATSINQSITGYGEYKLYLNGSSTAACSQTITKKEESGGMCTSGAIVKTYTCTPGGAGNTGNFDTAGAVCVKIKGSFGGWGFSNSDGRKWRINGGSFGTTSGESVDATSDGYVYIDITAGSFTWASVYWYNCK